MASKRRFRIGDLAKKLNIETFVIRYWEKEFEIQPHRTKGGQRYYRIKDLKFFQQVKELLYEKGYTITGAKKHLMVEKARLIPSQKTYLDEKQEEPQNWQQMEQQMIHLQKLLIKLRHHL